MNDLRFAFRQLLKSPGFSILAIVTLAVGIGLNAAIFSLIHDLFLNSLPFEEPARIIRVFAQSKEANIEQAGLSVPKFMQYRDAQSVFSEFAADAGTGFNLTGLGDPIQIFGANITSNYFHMLGVKPILGRLFLPEEEMKANVALITEHFWKSKLHGDPQVLGQTIMLSGEPKTIVGVVPTMPVAWFGPNLEVFCTKPFELAGVPKENLMRGVSYLRVFGRLKPGVTMAQAKANIDAAHATYRSQYASNADVAWTPTLISAPDDVTAQLRPAFLTLLAAVAVVLLIACSNVANLLLVRFTGRRREISLRVALGASRSGIVRLFVIESTVISLVAGVLGILLALWALPVVPRLAGQNLPLEQFHGLNLPVLFFALGLSILVGLAMGAYPALQSSKSDLVDGLKEGGRGTSGSVSQQRFRRILVGGQVCLSVVLLAGAGLLITSFLRLSKERAGFRVDQLWVGGVGMPPSRYPDKAAYARFEQQLQNELQASPGVEAVAVSDSVPLGYGGNSSTPYARADRNPPPLNQRPLALNHSISPGYLATFGIPLISGRNFNEHDDVNSPPVALISQGGAKKLFPNEDPVGHQMYFGADKGTGLLVEIVGVIGDTRFRQLDKTDDVQFFRPITQRVSPFFILTIRSAFRPDAAGGLARAALKKIDPDIPIIQPTTMTEILSDSLGPQRLATTLLGIFASVALLLAIIGINGAVAYSVAQRTGEIGVRMALGAQTRDVLRLVVRQGMTPVVLGVVAGILAALLLGRLLTTQLYQVSPHNPLLLALTAFVLAFVALLACLFPARRAANIDPIQALRTE